ncbi:hypothetical protein [Nonomuraea sp. NPDC050202]|jgi:hypothetical protein|uniref:hypothetical protein n=1 Tax=Nonomuraea sp. NPDC050202 TaxID=3155035 RepID=UPI0033F54956
MPRYYFEIPETGAQHDVRAPDEATARQVVVSQVYHDNPEGEGDQLYTKEQVEQMRQVRAERAAALILLC